MICDTDTLTSTSSQSSKTRLMGVNIHPSRKSEIEKKEEKEELITIRSAQSSSHSVHLVTDDCEGKKEEDGSVKRIDDDICTNNQIISHNLLHSVTESPRTTNDKSDIHVKKTRNLMNNDDNINENSNKNKNESVITELMRNTDSTEDCSNIVENNNSNIVNDKINIINSIDENNTIDINNNNRSNNNIFNNLKNNPLSSISSNLNLLEGDLPDEMLEDFDIPSGPITPSIAGVIFNVLKQGGRLSFKSVHKILRISYKFLSDLPNTTHCSVGESDRLTTVGDIHGRYCMHCIGHRYLFFILFQFE